MITFGLEKFVDFFPDAYKLFKQHVDEVDLFGLELDIDYNYYSNCCKGGTVKIFTLREGEELIGYAAFFLFQHNHHKASLHAKQDVLFIRKEKRGIGLTFLKECDLQLKRMGVDVVHHCVPASRDWSPILKRIGYNKLETVYTRSL
jgi:hypothetical protein